MKKLYYLLFVTQLLFNFQSSNLYAQVEPPQGIIYQAEARDGNGNLIKNKALTVRISILAGSATSNIEWKGEYNIATDNNGLFTLIIGQGTTLQGSFSSITWGLSDHYLNVQINDKKGWVDMGTTQLLSVPYAFYAKTAANGITSAQIDAINANTLKRTYPAEDQTKLGTIQTGAEKNVNADWNATSGEAQILNKPILAAVAISGSYNDLNNKPTGTQPGDMQYWDGTAWVLVPAGQPGQFLQFTALNKPEWTTVSQNNNGGNPPTINTNSVTNVTSNSATSGGSIMNNDGVQITSCGVCCSPNHNPTITDYRTNDNLGNGTFTSNLNGLSPGTYYVRAYATFNGGTIYGNEVSFTISMNTGQNYQLEYISGGNQTYPGGGMPQPMIFKVKNLTNNVYVTNLPAENLSITATASTGSQDVGFNNQNNYCGNGDNTCFGGFYTVPANNGFPYMLNIGVSLMKNNQNIFAFPLTENISSNNNGGTPFTVSTVGTIAISNNSAVCNSSINGDGSTITDHGVCWNTTGMPTINDLKTSQGAGSGNFTSNLSGLSPNTTYYVRAYATNSAGATYGTVINFTTTNNNISNINVETMPMTAITTTSVMTGGVLVSTDGSQTAEGVCWSTSQNPTLSNSYNSIGTLGTYTCTITNLSPGTVYYVRAYVTNSAGTIYGNQIMFTTAAIGQLPVVTTTSATVTSSTTATLLGNVVFDGGITVARGICYSTTPNPTTANNTLNGQYGTGVYALDATGLNPSTTYYFKAYITSIYGTSYGDEMSFTTPANVQTLTVITTPSPLNVTATTATFNGNIISDGGHPVTACGMCWNTTGNPTYNDLKTISGVLTGNYLGILTDLVANTTYFIRAYAINIDGIAYGNEVRFTMQATGQTQTVTDIDNNVYQTVTIGSQVWMAENLKTTKYRNGDPIPNVTNASAWFDLTKTIGSYCNFNNDANNATTYGRLYNWYAVKDSRNIAPAGWHVPSQAEWATLIASLGGDAVAGGKLKETGTSHWMATNYGATNESQFTALPGGYISDFNFTFTGMGIMGYWWSSTENSGTSQSFSQYLTNTTFNIYGYYCNEKNGYSIRCVKD